MQAMNLDEAIAELRRRNQPVPLPGRLPTSEEVEAMETQLGVSFPKDYRRFLLQASDVVYGIHEPATVDNPRAHTHLPKVVASARAYGVPEELFPFCKDNADFYCLTPSEQVQFWSHNGWSRETWHDLAHWIHDVWLGSA